MDIRFIVNTVIIILIIHFILENIDIKIEIGGRGEQFRIQKLDPEASMKFLTGEDSLEGFDVRQDLIDYINNNSKDIRGKEFYKTDFNTPHFNSNLTDVHSFYNINYDPNDCNHKGF